MKIGGRGAKGGEQEGLWLRRGQEGGQKSFLHILGYKRKRVKEKKSFL